MRIKLDENLPENLAASLETLGHDIHTTRQEGLAGAADLRANPPSDTPRHRLGRASDQPAL